MNSKHACSNETSYKIENKVINVDVVLTEHMFDITANLRLSKLVYSIMKL